MSAASSTLRVSGPAASNEKLLMSMALFKELGEDFSFQTSVLAASEPVAGLVTSDVYLSGQGDPAVTSASSFDRYFPFQTTSSESPTVCLTRSRSSGSAASRTSSSTTRDVMWIARH